MGRRVSDPQTRGVPRARRSGLCNTRGMFHMPVSKPTSPPPTSDNIAGGSGRKILSERDPEGGERGERDPAPDWGAEMGIPGVPKITRSLCPWRSAAGKVLYGRCTIKSLMIYYIMLFAVLLGLAKKGRRGRRFRRYLKGKINMSFNITALASKDAVSQQVADSVSERAWVSSIKAVFSLSEFTPGNDIGPIMIGVAHSDYTAAEIEEWIEGAGSWTEGDKIQQERSRRYIRVIGVFETPDDATDSVSLNDGRMLRVKCGWILNAGQTCSIWAYNQGTGAVATTVPQINVDGHFNIWPQ